MDGKLTELVSRLKEAAGKNLESVILYGSAARGDYKPGKSDLNVLCTLVDLSFPELQQRVHVNERAQAADKAADFSRRIRAGNDR